MFWQHLATSFLTLLLSAAIACGREAGGEVWRLVDVRTGDGQVAQVETGVDETAIRNAATISAQMIAPNDAFLCRITPAGNPDIVQLSIGRVANSRCNALFSPSRDEAVSFEGERVELVWQGDHYGITARGPLRMRVVRDYMRKVRGVTYYQPLDKTVFSRAPAGWCSWYIYYQEVGEEDVVKNADWLAAHLKPFGLQYVQIDDGWQGVGHGFGDNRDWNVIAEKKFPHGMKWLADRIRSQGLSPGIWVVPFATSDRRLFDEQPALFIRKPDGKTPFEEIDPKTGKVKLTWSGLYRVDPTSPHARKWFEDLTRKLCLDWGYDFVKVDGQGDAVLACHQYRDLLADPKIAPDDAYRLELDAIKSVMGPKRFLLNCGNQYVSCGYCEGVRTGGDAGGPDWSRLAFMLDATYGHLFKNNICFWNDPDTICVRPPLTLDQARACATLVGITGQLIMFSDDMTQLPLDRVGMLKRILPAADIRPMDLYPYEGKPRIFDVRVAKPGMEPWDVLAVFNWDEHKAASLVVEPKDLGLPTGDYLYYDAWEKKLLGTSESGWKLTLPPTSCRLLTVRPRVDRPQLLGTSRHITQGADDLIEARWNPEAMTWSGKSAVVGGDPYELRFTLPAGWKCTSPAAKLESGLVVLTLTNQQSSAMPWSITFRKEN